MNYKSLSLAALLLPFSSYGINKNEARIKELEEAQFQKASELKELATQLVAVGYESYVSEKIDYAREKTINLLSEASANKNKSKQEIGTKLEKENEVFGKKLLQALLNEANYDIDIKKSLFFEGENFDLFKSIFVEGAVSEFYLRLLAERFKNCLSEVLRINKEIKKLRT